ncbi:TAXI family TRAP transporter solute-binding subunit [Tateyamaria sp. SN3-11]|uniref:TAXI family TRAP transporter solute-binding subunit n=1 Tax=Tateyamaria sp. SN3-11 TaxID=3092147 RepID=UPI0039E963CF
MTVLQSAILAIAIFIGAALQPSSVTAQGSASANRDTVGIMAGSVRGTYSRFAQDMADALDQEGRLRVIAQLGRGSIKNVDDLLFLRGVDLAIVQSDVLEWYRQNGVEGVSDIGSKINYVMKLYNEEIHFLVREDILSIKDLDGQRVSMGGAGSGTFLTSTQVFGSFGIAPIPLNMSNSEAVSGVRSGDLAGAVFVVGKPASYFSEITLGDGVKLLPVEIDRQLEDRGYISTVLTSSDYPNLVREGVSIESIAVGAVLAAYNWKSSSSRYDRVRNFTEDLLGALPRLQSDPSFHPKWKDVDPFATVPGWKRFSAASEALGQ